MGKGRRPCCDKAGVKKGPWSQAEDLKLVSFIQKHGHSNWRALPKLAGLARCGKSCRLRWVNYLRPDLKRGNFTPQEEETIIKLHESLGSKWSKIASHFPGRTDNEIKNVWNTHLKKRLKDKKSNNEYVIPTLTQDESYIDCSEQVLLHETSLTDKGDPNSHMIVQNVCDKGGATSVEVDKIEEELIEIPFEANLDLWDLLDGDSNSTNHSDYVQSNELNSPKFNSTSEIDKKDYKESDRSWWWILYLENELGLDHNEATTIQSTSNSNVGCFSNITI